MQLTIFDFLEIDTFFVNGAMYAQVFLRYCGKVSNILLFSVNDFQSDYYYAFAYIDKNTLIIGSKNGCRDIYIKKLKLVNL